MSDSIIYNNNDLKIFLSSFIKVVGDIDQFIDTCQRSEKKKLMLNRLYWYVQMADIDNDELPDSAKLTFLLAMAEANIKIRDGRFNAEGGSTKDVERFFCCMTDSTKKQLLECIKEKQPKFLDKIHPDSKVVSIVELPIDFYKVIEIFLNVRHRFVHGKNIFSFRFNELPKNLINELEGESGKNETKIRYESTLTYQVFKSVVIETALKNIQSIL